MGFTASSTVPCRQQGTMYMYLTRHCSGDINPRDIHIASGKASVDGPTYLEACSFQADEGRALGECSSLCSALLRSSTRGAVSDKRQPLTSTALQPSAVTAVRRHTTRGELEKTCFTATRFLVHTPRDSRLYQGAWPPEEVSRKRRHPFIAGMWRASTEF